ncbi:MAG: hypothetical protein A2V67_10535 [Deltaproteobacteria bacterium RBG_13_61_14]|nr:MAG: hypothetical protein A2V67_10535 [Deltaproteobacteria bacterium RBG_13_61_14]
MRQGQTPADGLGRGRGRALGQRRAQLGPAQHLLGFFQQRFLVRDVHQIFLGQKDFNMILGLGKKTREKGCVLFRVSAKL